MSYFDNIPVYYLFTPLSGDAYVSTKDGKIYQGAYYQISAWGRLFNTIPTLLQSTDVIVAPKQNPEKIFPADTPVIPVGRMSWRQIL